MGTLTNKNGLPQPVVDAIKHDSYKFSGTISTTQLIDAPQIRILKKKHGHELDSDVSEYLWALMGTAVHHVLERAHIKDSRKQAFLTVIDVIKEKSLDYTGDDQKALRSLADKLIKLMVQFFPELESRYIWETTLHFEYGGQILSGTFDIYDKVEKCLYDYKVCSVFAYTYPESRKKWAAQTNTYAYMLREAGEEVNEIRIVAIFRDWSASKLEFAKSDYPPQQFMTLPIPVVEHHKMEKYIKGRIDLHIAAENGNVPECSGVERWASASEFAIKKPGLKKALRKFPTEVEAATFIRENQHKHAVPLAIDVRPGESKRCENYCPVRDFCPQKKRMDKEHEEMLKTLK
jgi:hypothetical protein